MLNGRSPEPTHLTPHMTIWRFSKNVTGAILGFALVLLIAAGTGFAYWSINRTLDAFKLVDHTLRVRIELEHFLGNIVNAETAERGYLLTGNDISLNLFQPSVDASRRSMESLGTLTAGNGDQQAQLKLLAPLFAQKIARMESQMKVRREQGVEAVIPIVATLEGKQLMDDIRGIIKKMEEDENVLLTQRSEAARKASVITLVVVTLGSAAAILLLGIAAVLVWRELKHRRQASKALEAGKSYAESIVDTIREPLLVVDGEWRVQKANRSYYKAFQVPREKTEGIPVFELAEGAWNIPALRSLMEEAIEKGKPFDDLEIEREFPGLGLRALQLNGRKLYRPGNHTQTMLLAIEDITERKRIENVHLQFRSLFESLPGLYVVLKTDFTIAAVSDAYLKATMTRREEILGRGLFEVFPDNPDDPAATGVSNLRASLNRVLQDVRPDTMAIQKYDVQRPDGVFEERFWSPVNSPVLGADSRLEYIIHRVEDVTDFVKQKERASAGPDGLHVRMEQMESEIFKSNQQVEAANKQLLAANAELEAFSYSVSHDLRAPLRHIDGFADMLSRHAGAKLDEKGNRFIATISESAKRMGALIDDLLVFSRMGRAEMHTAKVDMDALAQDVIREVMQPEKGRRVEWKCDLLPDVTGDKALLRQVLVNLFSNAVKYSRPRDPAIIEIGCTDGEAGEKIFFVRDNGVGFDMTYADKLFGVFQRLHRASEFEGTGIGLANVRRIILRHGGRTWAEGKLDAGSTFYFSLPLHLAPA